MMTKLLIPCLLLLASLTNCSVEQTSRLDKVNVKMISRIVRSNNDPMLINYWATWCKPCIRELPHLIAFARARQARLILVSLDDERQQDRAYQVLKQNGGEEFGLHLVDRDENLQSLKQDWYGAVPLTMAYKGPELKESYERELTDSDFQNIATLLNTKQ